MKYFIMLFVIFSTSSAFAQTMIFSNGCTRTCTGNWSSNANGTYSCDGTAGPLMCGGAIRNTSGHSLKLFDASGVGVLTKEAPRVLKNVLSK